MMVITSDGDRKPMSKLRIGDKILAHDPIEKKLVFSEVLTFLDYKPSEIRIFTEIVLKSGRTLIVTPTHLVFKGNIDNAVEVYAGNLVKGDILLIKDVDNVLNEDVVVTVRAIKDKGIYAPLTEIGTVVVNDVIASCYAVVDSQSMAHTSFAPLRFTIKTKRFMSDMWYEMKSYFSSNSNYIERLSYYKMNSEGVHWYAKVLYSVANLFIPEHIH